MKAIGRTEMLTHEEVNELASLTKEMLSWREARESKREALGRDPTESEMAAVHGLALQAYRERLEVLHGANERLVCANLRLVVAIAKRYATRNSQQPAQRTAAH